MGARLRRVDPSLAAIVAEGFLSRLSFGLVTFALPLYAFRELGLSLAEVGFLASFNLMVAIALKPLMGALADRFGLRRGLATAIGMRSLVSLLLVFVAAPWQLLAVRGLHGVSISLRDPSVNALIAEHGGKRTIASAFAWYQTAKSVAGSAGKVLAGVLLTLTASSFSVVFLVAFVLSTLPLIVVLRYVRAPPPGAIHEEASADSVAPDEADQGDDARGARPPIGRFMGLGFLISGTAYMLANLFPVFAVEYAGLSEAAAGSLYAFGTVAMLTAPAFGWLSDNVSRKLVLSMRSVANVLSSVLYLVAPSYGGLAAGRTLDDMGKAAFRPAWGALMAHVSSYSPRRRARTMGYLSVGEDAGEMAGPIVAGLLWATWGVPVLLGVRIALAIVAELYTLALTSSLRKLDEQPPADRQARPRTETALRIRAGPASAAEP